MLIQIEDGLAINISNIESVERKGQMSSLLTMQSGSKHLTPIPYEAMVKIASKESKMDEVLKNIDMNTQRLSS